MAQEKKKHAIVIGGSLAGLLAARVLSDHYEQVTIIERDAMHDQPESRKGQPQTQHLHGLLGRGREIMEGLFPGLTQTLMDGGGVLANFGEDVRWYHFDGYKTRFDTELEGFCASRPFLEWHIQRRVRAIPSITIRDSSWVEALIASEDGQSITGVEIGDPDDGDQRVVLDADLVVDASGRGSPAPRWLSGLGYEPPEEEEVTIRLGYATRIYRRESHHLQGAKVLLVSPKPPEEKRGAFLFPVEDDRWILTVSGFVGDFPPGDAGGFMAFVKSLPSRGIYDVIQQAEPVSEIVTYRFQANRRRRYERLNRFPEGYLVIGDAVASFNPIYAQGMTSAAMQTLALDAYARSGRGPGRWRPYFKAVARVIDLPWSMAIGEDFRYPQAEGRKPFGTDILNGYVGLIHHAVHDDPVVYEQFLRVMNMFERPESLMRPHIAWRVLKPRRREG